jgi:hypothetical protein
MAAAFAVVAVVRGLGRGPWPAVAVPACLAVAIGAAAWLGLLFKVASKTPAAKSRKLAGPGGA